MMENSNQNKIDVTLAELIEIGLLRSVAGFGLGLLLAEQFKKKNRKTIGWSLFLGSIAVGVPIGIKFLKKNKGI
ncbi:MAG TPA: hypothetical protein VK892_02485, partial [Pyrinomonadaceae bacterium]|nr:hypothetical protein [Pyrinomonadaceae bacterium]